MKQKGSLWVVAAAIAVLALTVASARADTFLVSGTFDDSSTFNGTLNLDPSTLAFTSFNIVTNWHTYDSSTFHNYVIVHNVLGDAYFSFIDDANAINVLDLWFKLENNKFQGGNLDLSAAGPLFEAENSAFRRITEGSAAAVPEPSGLLLLGTGLSGLVGVIRRKFAA